MLKRRDITTRPGTIYIYICVAEGGWDLVLRIQADDGEEVTGARA